MPGKEASAARLEAPSSADRPSPAGVDFDALDRAAEGILPSWVGSQPGAPTPTESVVIASERGSNAPASGALPLPAVAPSASLPSPALPSPAADVFAPIAPPAARLAPESFSSSSPSRSLSNPDSTQPMAPIPGLTSLSDHPVLQPVRDLIVHRPRLALAGAAILGSLLLAMLWPSSSEPTHAPAPPAPVAAPHAATPPAPAEPVAPQPSEAAQAPEAAPPVETAKPTQRGAKQKRGAAAVRGARDAAKPAITARLAAPKATPLTAPKAAAKKPPEPAKATKPAGTARQSLAPNPYR